MENRSLKYWKIFAFVLVALNITLIVFLLIGPPGRPPLREGANDPGKFLIEKLKFTSQQESEFNKLRKAHHASTEALKDEGKKLKESFFEGLTSDSLNSNKDSIAAKIAENQKQIELVTYDHFTAVKKLCTPDQKVIFNDIIGEVVEKLGRPRPEMR
jgi:periplasmic protein CpxP/Spy